MQTLNYQHLYYFWMVAHEGSVSRAGERLRLRQPTVSAQLKSFQETLGVRLLERQGRGLVTTAAGRRVLAFADEIFALGGELVRAARAPGVELARRFEVGVSDVLPKLLVHRVLEPVLRLAEPVQLVCREDRVERLLGELSTHALDLVLAEAPLPPTSSVRAYSHLLGECGVTLVAVPALAARLRRGFPGSLADAPLLLPSGDTVLRASLDRWFEARRVRPRVVAEFEDSATLKAFGHAGHGALPVPAVIAATVERQYGLRRVAALDGVRARLYAISLERKVSHPALVAITEASRGRLFGARAARS